MAEAVQIDGRDVELTHLDKVMFPDAGLRKRDLVDYYKRIAESILPHLRGRPLTLQRFPNGIASDGFYQKEASDYFPEWVRREKLPKEGGKVSYVICDDAATLVYLANQGMITPHVWLSHADKPKKPDQLIFDLDPPGENVDAARFAARVVRDVMDDAGLDSFIKTTGSRGFHVMTPLAPEEDFDTVREFARLVAKIAVNRKPDELTVEQRKADRKDRAFVDYLRNAYAQMAVAPYAVRAKPGAPVATPIGWDELGDCTPQRYNIRNIFRRLGQKKDPWAKALKSAQKLDRARDAIQAMA